LPGPENVMTDIGLRPHCADPATLAACIAEQTVGT
jgi:hypothetical protein